MLTDKCKKHLKQILKDRYNVECYRIVEAQQNAYNYFYYTLICVRENKGFEMLLTISRQMRHPTLLRTHVVFKDIQPDIDSDEFIDDYDFTIDVDFTNVELIPIFSDMIHNNLIVDSMQFVNNQFSLGVDCRLYMLYTKIIPIIGILKKEKGWFNVKTVSDHPYFAGNLCSTFFNEKKSKNVRSVLFNFFIFGEKFNYVTSKKAEQSSDHHVNANLMEINEATLSEFKKIAFQELFFDYSNYFDFKIENMTKKELCELDIDDFVKYIEVQKMIQI